MLHCQVQHDLSSLFEEAPADFQHLGFQCVSTYDALSAFDFLIEALLAGCVPSLLNSFQQALRHAVQHVREQAGRCKATKVDQHMAT